MRGDIHRLKPRRGATRHEQKGSRYGVVIQRDLPISTVVICPTSTSVNPGMMRPAIQVQGRETFVLVEQMNAVDVQSLGDLVGRVTRDEMQGINQAIQLVLDLD